MPSPISISKASSWDTELIREVGTALGEEYPRDQSDQRFDGLTK
jgi:beta-glucosidase-like glycosyl hydrolase